MSYVAIPMFDLADFSESVTLDGNEYKLHFYWNTRGAFWSMDIADANSVPLVSGVKLIMDFPLLIQHTEDGLPEGIFLIQDTNPNTQYVEPGRGDFVGGRNLELMYWSKAA